MVPRVTETLRELVAGPDQPGWLWVPGAGGTSTGWPCK